MQVRGSCHFFSFFLQGELSKHYPKTRRTILQQDGVQIRTSRVDLNNYLLFVEKMQITYVKQNKETSNKKIIFVVL